MYLPATCNVQVLLPTLLYGLRIKSKDQYHFVFIECSAADYYEPHIKNLLHSFQLFVECHVGVRGRA